MKPHITMIRSCGVILWFCRYGTNPGSFGNTPTEAYELWLQDLPF